MPAYPADVPDPTAFGEPPVLPEALTAPPHPEALAELPEVNRTTSATSAAFINTTRS